MTTPDWGVIGRYARTVAHLRPSQIAHRVRLRVRQRLLRRWPSAFERRYRHPGGRPAWPATFAAIDLAIPPDCGPIDELERGVFTFLNETRDLGEHVAWDPPGASQLWLYHQHYWQWAWTLVQEPDDERSRSVFAYQFRSWVDATRFGRWNAWAPYPASLRAWVFVNVEAHLVRGTPIEESFHDALRLHAGFVEHNLELDVGGNHLIKNLKALIGLGVFFDDTRLIKKAVGRLARQLAVQILPDGGHFELSPSYHCQVLADLIDIDALLTASGRPPIAGVKHGIEQMRTWLGAMVMPDGDVPQFNDCERVGVRRIQALQPTPRPECVLTVLANSGYVVATPGDRIHLVADVGRPCPPDLPAHAHADCLSFELAIDGNRIVVDPGTSVYGSGVQRKWERGTPAHSTLTIDGENQTEVWGGFRAGRLADATLERALVERDVIEIRASHNGYRHLTGSPIHRRTWTVSPDGIDIIDDVEGRGIHTVDYRLLLDGDHVLKHSAGEIECVGCRVSIGDVDVDERGCSSLRAEDAEHALGHGVTRNALAVSGRWTVDLPARLDTRIELT